jgi:hypothetical protein
MSVDISFYFNAPGTLPEVAQAADGVLGCRFVPYEGNADDLFSRFLSFEMSLRRHDLVSDGPLDFDRFAFSIGLRVPVPDSALLGFQLETIGLVAHVLLLRGTATEGILVYDVQRLLARYEASAAGPIDRISGEPVVFPDHLDELRSRL